MAAFQANTLNFLEDDLRNTLQDDNSLAENSGNSADFHSESENNSDDDTAFGIDPDLNGINSSNDALSPGPGDEEDDDEEEEDDDDLLDDDDETLIPIEGDEEDDDSLLSADDDEDVIPGTDLDDDDLDDDDDNYDEDAPASRSTLGDIGGNNSSRDAGRSTGRMIDHEPGTNEI